MIRFHINAIISRVINNKYTIIVSHSMVEELIIEDNRTCWCGFFCRESITSHRRFSIILSWKSIGVFVWDRILNWRKNQRSSINLKNLRFDIPISQISLNACSLIPVIFWYNLNLSSYLARSRGLKFSAIVALSKLSTDILQNTCNFILKLFIVADPIVIYIPIEYR